MSQQLITQAHEPAEMTGANRIVLGTLTVLLIVTIALAFLRLPGWLGLCVAMTIAGVKALLIATWFMHLRYSPRLTVVAASVGFVWLGILFVLIFNDYAAR